jgi:hypothetical protein
MQHTVTRAYWIHRKECRAADRSLWNSHFGYKSVSLRKRSHHILFTVLFETVDFLNSINDSFLKWCLKNLDVLEDTFLIAITIFTVMAEASQK